MTPLAAFSGSKSPVRRQASLRPAALRATPLARRNTRVYLRNGPLSRRRLFTTQVIEKRLADEVAGRHGVEAAHLGSQLGVIDADLDAVAHLHHPRWKRAVGRAVHAQLGDLGFDRLLVDAQALEHLGAQSLGLAEDAK